MLIGPYKDPKNAGFYAVHSDSNPERRWISTSATKALSLAQTANPAEPVAVDVAYVPPPKPVVI